MRPELALALERLATIRGAFALLIALEAGVVVGARAVRRLEDFKGFAPDVLAWLRQPTPAEEQAAAPALKIKPGVAFVLEGEELLELAERERAEPVEVNPSPFRLNLKRLG